MNAETEQYHVVQEPGHSPFHLTVALYKTTSKLRWGIKTKAAEQNCPTATDYQGEVQN